MISSSSLSVMVSKSANVSVWDIDGLRGKHRRQNVPKALAQSVVDQGKKREKQKAFRLIPGFSQT